MATAVFRCDAGPDIGAGHVMRCLALAEALQADGWQIGFAVSSKTVEAVPHLGNSGWQAVGGFEGGPGDQRLFRSGWPAGVDLLVVDHYAIAADYEAALANWARRRLVIDDLADRPHACDFLVDQGLQRTAKDYARLLPANCSLLLGPDYAVLRSDFAAWRSRCARQSREKQPSDVLVSMGMFDEKNASLQVLRALDRCRFGGTVHLLLGSGAPHLPAIEREAKSFGFETRLHKDAAPAEIIATLLQADLAIGSGGVSALERCCLGVPSLIVALADNQQANVSALAAHGAARQVEWSCLRDPSCLADVIEQALHDPQARSAMSLAGRLLIDGRGAQRIALALSPEKTRAGAVTMLRKIRAEDVDQLFAWQNEPEARRYSRNPEPPTRPEHEAWFARTLADPAVLFCMILVGDTPAGTVRLAAVDAEQAVGRDLYEVSILIAEKFRGQGVGLAALRSLHRLAPEAIVDAHVLDGNAASHRLFQSLGYAQVAGRYRFTPRVSAR